MDSRVFVYEAQDGSGDEARLDLPYGWQPPVELKVPIDTTRGSGYEIFDLVGHVSEGEGS